VALKRTVSAVEERSDVEDILTGEMGRAALERAVSAIWEKKDVKDSLTGEVWRGWPLNGKFLCG
jgi:hypothetical protein